jgi:hypothetical protein
MSTNTHCVPGTSPIQNTKKSCRFFFQTPPFQKVKGSHEKYHFLVDMDFLSKKIKNLTCNFT